MGGLSIDLLYCIIELKLLLKCLKDLPFLTLSAHKKNIMLVTGELEDRRRVCWNISMHLSGDLPAYVVLLYLPSLVLDSITSNPNPKRLE